MKKLYNLVFQYRGITLVELLRGLSLPPNRFLRMKEIRFLDELHFFLYLKPEEAVLFKVKYSNAQIWKMSS